MSRQEAVDSRLHHGLCFSVVWYWCGQVTGQEAAVRKKEKAGSVYQTTDQQTWCVGGAH
jgi:hypothetical protein